MAHIRLPDRPLTDGVLSLRPWRADDVPALVAAVSDPEIPYWTTVPSPYAESDATSWFATHAPALETQTGLSFAIVDAASDELLGSIGLVSVTVEDARAEVGYWVGAHARRRGVATAAVRVLAAYVLRDLEFERLELYADVDNVASRGVAERAGFTLEGVARSFAWRGAERRDFAVYSLLPSELPQRWLPPHA